MSSSRTRSAEALPRKIRVSTVVFGPRGYPGPVERARELAALVGPGDLVVLPECALTSNVGSAHERALPLDSPAMAVLSEAARRNNTYVVAGLDLAESGPVYSNAAVLLDRAGEVAGVYRKVHLAPGGDVGITPGKEFPVFPCDFGTLGIQICWDIRYPDGWAALADADIVAWPSASPATVLPAAHAAQHRYYLVSSTPRDNATIFEPTGMVVAQVESGVLTKDIDVSYAILGWSERLRDGAALREKYGDRVGFHYSSREDVGLFWSNDPVTSIGEMTRTLGLKDIEEEIQRW